jgi:hypothetical protein
MLSLDGAHRAPCACRQLPAQFAEFQHRIESVQRLPVYHHMGRDMHLRWFSDEI